MIAADFNSENMANDAGLKPPQFRLRTMLIVVALLCVLLTVMVAMGMFWAMGLLLFLMLIAAHVVGNSLGTQLRDHGSRIAVGTQTPEEMASSGLRNRPAASPWQAPQAGRMQEKRPTSWLLIGLSAVGAVVSGILGGLLISSLYWEKIGLGAIMIAALASGIMGGMAVFLTGSFIDMVQRVWREATTETQPVKK